MGANGAGKSTILDALTFSLFGKAYRKINKPQLVNSDNKKNCVVEVEFRIGQNEYLVRRGIKPNLFEVFANGELVKQESNTKDYQEILETQILKMTYKSFTQILILGSRSYKPFMRLEPADRRSVIDDLLDIQVFSVMLVLAKKNLSESKEEIGNLRIEHAKFRDEVDMLESINTRIQNNLNVDATNLHDELNAKTSLLNEKIQSIHKLKNLEPVFREKLETLQDKTKKLDELLRIKFQLETKGEEKDKTVSFFAKHSSCPVCKQEIDETHKAEILDAITHSKQQILELIVDAERKIADAHKLNKDYEDFRVSFDQLKTKIRLKENDVSHVESVIADLKTRIHKIETDDMRSTLQDNDFRIKEIMLKIDEYRQKIDSTQSKIEMYQSVIEILKDDGIKAQIIKQYIPLINKYINEFLLELDFIVHFSLDETFTEKIEAKYKDIFTYENFSEGEKSRIDLAILFTWRKIAELRNSVSSNILIMDETFDSSLDNVDDIMRLLKKMTNNNITIISHREDMRDSFDRIMTVKKEGYYSVYKDMKNG